MSDGKPRKGKWIWMGSDHVTFKGAIKKIKNQNDEIQWKVTAEDTANSSVTSKREKIKKSKKTHNKSQSADYRYYTKKRRSTRHGTSYYERFRVAPSVCGIKFYGTKP